MVGLPHEHGMVVVRVQYRNSHLHVASEARLNIPGLHTVYETCNYYNICYYYNISNNLLIQNIMKNYTDMKSIITNYNTTYLNYYREVVFDFSIKRHASGLDDARGRPDCEILVGI